MPPKYCDELKALSDKLDKTAIPKPQKDPIVAAIATAWGVNGCGNI